MEFHFIFTGKRCMRAVSWPREPVKIPRTMRNGPETPYPPIDRVDSRGLHDLPESAALAYCTRHRQYQFQFKGEGYS